MSFDFDKFLNDLKGLFKTGNSNKSTDSVLDEELKKDLDFIEANKNELDKEIKTVIQNETGMQRIEKLFEQKINPDIDEYIISTYRLFLVGFILGGLNRVASTADNYKRANQLTVFADNRSANKSFAQFIVLQTLKGGLGWGFKFGAFGAIGLGVALLLDAYKNKTTPLNHVIGLSASGALFRMHYGLRNFVFAGVYGGLLGGIYGTGVYFNKKWSGTLYEQNHYNELLKEVVAKKKFEKMFSDK